MMNYKPKALDVDRMERMFDMYGECQHERHLVEAAKVEAFNSGYKQAIEDCRGSLSCSNYELSFPSEREIIREAFYELCKELDISGSDVYDNPKLCLDEMAATLAERIREFLGRGE